MVYSHALMFGQTIFCGQAKIITPVCDISVMSARYPLVSVLAALRVRAVVLKLVQPDLVSIQCILEHAEDAFVDEQRPVP